jgi:hypothetical protein
MRSPTLESQCVPLPEGLAIPNAFTCKVPKAFTVMQNEAGAQNARHPDNFVTV